MRKVAWLSERQFFDDEIEKLLIDNDISILVEFPHQQLWNDYKDIGTTFKEARHFHYAEEPTAFLDEPLSHGKDWAKFKDKIVKGGGTVGEPSMPYLREAIKQGAKKVVYTSYAQYLFTIPILGWNVRNPFRNQIPTVKKMIKEFGKERVPAIFLNLALNRGDYSEIVQFAKDNNLILGIIRENNSKGDQSIESIVKDLKHLQLYL